MTAEHFDVVIVGAGPSGSTCALALGHSGLKVALLDKSTFPRDKTCGDALAAYIPKVLRTIRPEYAEAFLKLPEKEPITVMRVIAPNGSMLESKSVEAGYIQKRVDFDNFLLGLVAKLPNVRIFNGTEVTEVKVTEDRVLIQTSGEKAFSASLVIGCDGAQGIVTRQLSSVKVDREHYCGAVRAYFENVKDIPPSTLEIHLFKKTLPGYLWIFPLPNNQANVGLGLHSQMLSNSKLNLRKELQRLLQEEPRLRDRFGEARMLGDIQGYGLPLGSRKVTVSGDRFMLCGDAASLIDPISGEGIGQAMISGRYAGWQALKCFETGNFSASFTKQYDQMLYDKLWKTHHRHHLLRRIAGNRTWLVNGVFRLASNTKWLKTLLQKMM